MEREQEEDDPYKGIGFGDFGTYIKHKKQKLQIQHDEIAALASSDTPQIFERVVIYVNGYTDPPIHDLRNMIVQRGGEFRQFLSKSQITHIIASNLTQAKMKEFRNYKVAKPAWIVESVRANRLLPWHKFSTIRVPETFSKFGAQFQSSPSSTSSLTPTATDSLGVLTSSRSELDSAVDKDKDKDKDMDMDNGTASTNPLQENIPDTQKFNLSAAEPLSSGIDAESDQDMDISAFMDVDAAPWGDTAFDESLDVIDEVFTPPIAPQGSDVGDHMLEQKDDEDEAFFKNLDLDQLEYQASPPTAAARSRSFRDIAETQSDKGVEQPIQVQPNWKQTGQTAALSTTNRHIVHNPFALSDMPPPIATASADDGSIGMGDEVVVAGGEVDNRHPTLIELSVPWNRLNSSIQPGFVEKYYQSSRLHYLSTWKAKLREVTAQIQKDKVTIPSKSRNKSIMHVDFDCFFASVATRDKPELLNKPIAVAHGSGGSTSNSEIASCNYLAREFGVKNGMQLKGARALCPDLIVVPYEFQQYEDISIDFYKILLSYADELQAVSVDEALVDVSSRCSPDWDEQDNVQLRHGVPSGQETAEAMQRMCPKELVQRVRDEIFQATGCHASVGMGPNILLAKLSTKRAKPHGQYIWPSAPGTERTLSELQGDAFSPLGADSHDQGSAHFSSSYYGASQATQQPTTGPESTIVNKPKRRDALNIKDLPGVGYKLIQDLQGRFSVQTLYELQQISREELQRICGMKTGEMLYNSCRGIDETTLASDREKARQSVSAEISWGVRFENQDQVNDFVRDLSQEVSKRLKEIDRKGKSVIIKVMKRKEFVKGRWKHLGHGPVDNFARTGQLPMYTDDPVLIAKEALNLLRYFKFDVLDLRGLGIQVVKLNNDVVHTVPKSIFEAQDSMNQTTLTSAMFQQRRVQQPPPKPENESGSRINDDIVVPPVNQEQHARMEIDSETFKELPKEIQDELSRHHRLVFINQSPRGTNNHQGSESELSSLDHSQQGDPIQPRVAEEDEGTAAPNQHSQLPPWSQVNPAELMALSTPVMRETLEAYANRQLAGHGLHTEGLQNQPTDDTILPSPSKLDKSVLQALPPEIRAEIEQEYTHIMQNNALIQKLVKPSSSSNRSKSQNTGHLLGNQGPIIDQPAQGSSSRGRGRGSTSRSTGRGRPRGRPRGRGNGRSGSTKRGNVYEDEDSGREEEADNHANDPSGMVPELDRDFLNALPADIRAEIEAAHQLELVKIRLKNGTRSAATRSRNRKQHGVDHTVRMINSIPDPVVPEKPTLMGQREVEPLRTMLGEWVQSTLVQNDVLKDQETGQDNSSDQGSSESKSDHHAAALYDEGPNPEDVRSFSDFLVRVIFMERDLERVRLLLRCLRRKIEVNERMAAPVDADSKHVRVVMTWRQAFESVQDVVQRLVLELYGGTLTLG
ncbi:deoxycytidyl transferase [Mortierella polycephala]|uniref:DNA repair protein REV1 n=1 Tax=Mortierella polycephala TaxID=41804 RepID=A0A9P6U3C0_9FUNG|nr:deoxycytidyl transferase [Mortierella polycephala]